MSRRTPVLDWSLLAGTISEKEFQAWVISEAERAGYKVYHTHDSRRSQPGFPDLVLAKPGEPVWFLELKSQKGDIDPEQQAWIDVLKQCPGVRAGVYRPIQKFEILALLKGETR